MADEEKKFISRAFTTSWQKKEMEKQKTKPWKQMIIHNHYKYHILFSYLYFYSNTISTIRKYHVHSSYLYFYSKSMISTTYKVRHLV